MADTFTQSEADWEDFVVWPGSTFIHELAALPNGFEWHYLGNAEVQSAEIRAVGVFPTAPQHGCGYAS